MCTVYILYRAVKDIAKLLQVVKEVLFLAPTKGSLRLKKKVEADAFLLSLNVSDEMELNQIEWNGWYQTKWNKIELKDTKVSKGASTNKAKPV